MADASRFSLRRGAILGATLFTATAMTLLFFFSRGFFTARAAISLIAEGNRFVQLHEAFDVSVVVESPRAFNTVAAIVRFPADRIAALAVSTDETPVDLWVDTPAIFNDQGRVVFSGGMTRGVTGSAQILTIRFQPKQLGEAVIDFEDASVLAHDGRGTELLGKQRDIAFFIRPSDRPSPDLNDDNRVNISDISRLLSRVGTDEAAYDLDGSGAVDAGDIRLMVSRFLQ